MKRILSLFMVFVMVLSLAPVTAFAADGPSITATANKSEAAIGDTIEVTVSLAGNPGFNDADLMLTFDRNILQFTGLKTVEFNGMQLIDGLFASGSTETNTTVGNEKYGAVLNARTEPVSTNSNLFTALFTVIGAGNTTVDVTVNALRNTANDGAITDYADFVTVTPSASIAVAGIPATAVTLSASELTLEEGFNHLLSATVEPTNTTDSIIWSSSDESVATVSNVGKIEAIKVGETTITATAGNASATCKVTVEGAKNIIAIDGTPSEVTGVKTITLGNEVLKLRSIYKVTIEGHEQATITNSDSGASDGIGFIGYTLSKSVVWGTAGSGSGTASVALNSTNQYTATISTKDLLVSYDDLKAALGDAEMAKLGVSENDNLALVVFDGPAYDYAVLIVVGAVPATGITLDESHIVLVGNEVTIGAEVAPSNHTDNIIWTSSDPTVASVDQNGKVTANKSGTVTITATVGECSDTCTVLVVDNSTEIAAPENDYRGRTVESVTVLGVGVDSYAWAKSSSTYTLTVYTSDENASAVLIYKMNRNGTPYEDVIVNGSVENYEGQLSKEIIVDGYNSLGTWNVEFKKAVPATSLDLNKTSTEILVNKTETLVATLSEGSTDTATWTSSDESIATVDANGKVTAIAEGTVTITAKVRDMEKTCTVTVKAVHADSISISGEGIENGKLRITKGSSVTLNSTTEPAEITDKIVWSTNKNDIVTMYTWNPGYIRATAPGTATITVTAGEGEHAKSASIEVEVYEVPAVSLTIDKTEATILTFEKLTLTATASPSDHTDGSITWTSSDTSVATVANGVVSPVKAGEATITAKVGNLEATCKVTVKEPEEGTVLYKDDGTYRNFWPASSPTAYINTLIMDGAKYETLANEGSVYTVTLPYTTAKDAEITLNAYAEGSQLSNLTLNWHEGDEAPTSWGGYENKFNHTFKLADGKATLIIRAFVTGRNSEGIKTFNFVVGEAPEYDITVADTENGTVTASAAKAAAGTVITLTPEPVVGYKLDSLKVMNGEDEVEVTNNTFTMPAAAVTVSASFVEITPDYSGSSSVTVTLSLSADEKFMVGPESEEIMAFKNITVPYFDLANYGLEEYYFVSETYGDDGDGLPGSDLVPGTAEYAEGKVTLLHLYIYALEVFYCGIEPDEAGQGYLYNAGLIGTNVFTISGGVGSSFMNQFWGGDCNLNYYVNYEYPLASGGWGSTSDQILLREGDMVTLGHFTGWSFYADTYSIFNYITADNAAPAQGDEITLTLYYAGPNLGQTDGTAQILNPYCLDVYYTPVDSPASEDVTDWEYLGTSDESGQLVVDTSELEPGKYIVAVPGQPGVDYPDDICSTPGGMILTVTAAAEEEECEHEFANGSCTLCGEPDPAFVPITGLALSSASTENGALALVTGGSEKLNVTITPVDANQGYSWSSDNEDVATVNNGIVTAVSAGTATITVTAGDASTFAAKSTPVTASVTVTVTEPAAGYTVKMPGDKTVTAGQPIQIPVTLGSTVNAAYNAFDITVTYPAALTLTSTEFDGLNVTCSEDSVRIKGYGEAKDAGTAPFTLSFEATAVGEHSVTVTAAKVDNSKGAIAADAPDAALIDAVTVITVTGYNVSLPENFTGEKVAAPNEDYSFAPPADNYNYTVTVTVGGEEVEVTPNDDGSYTIPAEKVTGEIVVTMERTGKEYSVTFTGEDMTGNPKAYYDAAYSAALTPAAGYNYSVSIKINGDAYSGHSIADNVYTIPGKDITGDIEFIVTKTLIPVTMHSITFTGDAAGCAPGNIEVKDGSDYSFQLSNTEVGYTYTVTVGGEPLTADETGKYTVKNIKADTEIVITKALAAATTVEVKDYVTKDGRKQVKLVLVKGELAEGKVFAYDDEAMYYSEQYQAWAYLDIATGEFTAETARAKVSTMPGELEAQTIAQTFDVNGSGAVDINDAQLAYDIYKPEMYTDFNTVSVLKFLNADVNNSYSVTTEDAAAVVAAIQ